MLGDRRLIELAYSMLFSLPGMPVIRYGEEIGMGDDLTLKERLSIRTPMHWSTRLNRGFSGAAKLVRPVISKGPYRYTQVNVASQRSDSASLLNKITRLARLRKQCPEIGWGKWDILDTGSEHVLAIRYDWKGRSLVTIHNFSPDPQQCQLSKILKPKSTLLNLLDNTQHQVGSKGEYTAQVPGYGYTWYRLVN
ncbi:alpha-amylase family glycosyl hydrolase [Spirosoma flavum]|uniref:Maltogenic Amylase C-terminal domain-containing protein n=1 Tax=Spirosoma flavum TaxID=2048557 RepID=A0ABW6AC21_9BACT